MAVEKDVKVIVEDKALNTLKIADAPVIEDTVAGDEMSVEDIRRYSTSDQGAVASKVRQCTQFIVGYIPTIFGDSMSKRLMAAINDFYNKITGSALQTTQISNGDLFLFFKLGYEWRVLLAVIRKMLKQRNMISSVNDAFGVKHFEAVFGAGSFKYVNDNYKDIVESVNELTANVNKRFPMPKGNAALQFEIDLISETYMDDPNGKGSLIDFKRIFRDTVSQSWFPSPGDPRLSSQGWNFWIGLDRNGASRLFTIPVNFGATDWFGTLHTICDTMIEETWYIDIMPYLTHLIDCGFVSDDAPFIEENTSGEWSPKYNPNILAFIRNGRYCGKLVNEITGGNFDIYEHSDGYVYEGKASMTVGSATSTVAGLHVFPLFAQDIIQSTELVRPTAFKGLVDNNPSTFLLNLEDYPSNGDTLKNVLSGQYLTKNSGYIYLAGSNVGSNGEQVFPLVDCCSSVLLSAVYYLNPGNNLYMGMPVTAFYMALDSRANVFIRSDCYAVDRTSDSWSTLADMLKLHAYNFYPNVRLLFSYATISSTSSCDLTQYVAGSYLPHDIDSLVEVPLSRMKIIFKEMAYHAWYDAAEVTIRGSRK